MKRENRISRRAAERAKREHFGIDRRSPQHFCSCFERRQRLAAIGSQPGTSRASRGIPHIFVRDRSCPYTFVTSGTAGFLLFCAPQPHKQFRFLFSDEVTE
jgi:hypothetical protein